MNTKKITIDVAEDAVEIVTQEAKENKRSRKSQLEIIIEAHADRRRKRLAGDTEDPK